VRAAREGAVHDWVILVVPADAAQIAERLAQALAGRVGTSGRPPQVIGVDEPADVRAGNLGGTARAWQIATSASPDLLPSLRAGATALMLHDAGAASRSAPWSLALAGRRGALPLPGGRTLTEVLVAQLAPLAATGAGVVDVAWTSQLFLPDLDPTTLRPPAHDLTKLVAPWQGTPPGVACRELGWFSTRPTLRFSPGGTFADVEAWQAHHADADPAADVGTFRVRLDLLDRLSRLDLPTPVDLDPGLTGPALDVRRPGPVLALLGEVPSVGVLPLGALRWWRLRRSSEVLRLLLDVGTTPALRALCGVVHPVTRCRLGGVTVAGPELSWEEVGAGVQIGGVTVRGAVLWRCDLEAGEVMDSVAVEVRGHTSLSRSAAVQSVGPIGEDALFLRVDSASEAQGEVVVGVDAPGGRDVVRLGLDVDPRAVDDVVVPPNRWSFRDLRGPSRGG
jgi:hypothetical protein